jgi:uncharacterized protein with NRDE domain
MCLIAFAIGVSERWPLMIAANRDEFLDRPTLPLARWQTPSGQEVLSGRDLRAGGTWMGITPGGRIAFLTNVRGARADAGARSRGELVTRWLESRDDAAGFVAALEDDGADYAGFNLVLGDFQRNAWAWVTNKPVVVSGASSLYLQALPPGLYGLSNAALDTPWPKTLALKQSLHAALEASPNLETATLQASLWSALGNRQRAPQEDLPATGVPLALEEALSSAFVDFPDHAYGTRSSTVLLAARDPASPSVQWNVQVEERTYGPARAEPVNLPVHPVSKRFTIQWQETAGVPQSLGR